MKKCMIKQTGKKALLSAGGRALALLLCLCSALSFCLPVNADTLEGARPASITSISVENVVVQSGTYQSFSGGVRFALAARNTNDLYLRANLSPSIPAYSLVSISMSVTGGSTSYAPVCFSGGWSFEVLNCDINGDNGNYTISALLYTTAVRDSIVLYNYTSNRNLMDLNSPQPYIQLNDPYYATLSQSLTAQDVEDIKRMELYIVNNTDVTQNGVRQQLNDIISSLGTNSSQLSTINQSVIAQGQATQNAIDEQTQQQEEQYEQEKQEEADREEQGQADSETAQGLFSFSVFNPFGGIFGLFSDGCISIPTIGGMLNKPDATYCPWFSSSLRSILTPVLGLSSSMLLFGFIVRWLSGNSGDIYGARNLGKELN